MLSATDRNYGITALHNYGFTVILPPEKLESQNFLPVKIEIFKTKTPLPYSVANLTRVPKEPSKTFFIINQILWSVGFEGIINSCSLRALCQKIFPASQNFSPIHYYRLKLKVKLTSTEDLKQVLGSTTQKKPED